MISIITPVYNTKQEWLDTFFDSLAKQSFQNFELVLINDGGVPPQLPKNHNFLIKYVNNAVNKGPGFCRQLGIEQASYDYVTFCDSDDYFYDENVIEKYINIINTQAPEIIVPKIITTTIQEEQDEHFVFLHGLCIAKSFLAKYNIVFPNLYFSEDRIFLHQCQQYVTSLIICDTNAIQHMPRKGSLFDFSGHHASSYIYDLFLQLSLIHMIALNPNYYYLEQKDACTTLLFNCTLLQDIRENCPDDIRDLLNNYEQYIYSCLWRYLPATLKSLVHHVKIDDTKIDQMKYHLLNNTHLISDIFPDKDFLLTTLQTFIEQAYVLWKARHFESTHDERPVLSIICPTYNNSEEELISFFDSINRQSAQHLIQLILVDDCSTLNILTDDFVDSHLCVPWKIIRLPFNRGVGYARKIGLDSTDTDFFMIMDADDELGSPYIVEEYYTYLYLHPTYAGAYGIEENIIAKDFCKEFGMHGLCGRTKQIQPYVNFRSFHYGEDIAFLVECKMQGLEFKFIPVLAYIRKASHLTGDINGDISYFLALNSLYNEVSIYVNLQNKTNVLSDDEFYTQKMLVGINTLMRYIFLLHQKKSANTWEKRSYLEMPSCISEEDQAILRLYYTIAICKIMPKEILYELYSHTYSEIEQYGTLPTAVYYVIGNLLLNIDVWSTEYNYNPMSFQELTRQAKVIIDKFYKEVSVSNQGKIPPQTKRNFPWCYDTYIYH